MCHGGGLKIAARWKELKQRTENVVRGKQEDIAKDKVPEALKMG